MKKFTFPDGATPLHDASGLLQNWILTQDDLTRAETANIDLAQEKYLKSPKEPSLWFTIKTLKTIHHAMFKNVWSWAGNFRKSETSIGIEPYRIPKQLGELCLEVTAWSDEAVHLTLLERAARIHHQLVWIHPFENGNGRFSRLIADRFLIAYHLPYPNWPPLQENGNNRSTYIHSLQQADRGNYKPLVQFMQNLGAKDPALSELLGLPIYKKVFSPEQKLALTKTLITAGSAINETVYNGFHPLHLALKTGLSKIALELIQHGAHITFRDKSGYDPFELAINNELFDVARELCNAGYPYTPGMLNSRKINHELLHQFEIEFLKRRPE